MISRHASAVLLLGWYLMVPPVEDLPRKDPGDGGGVPYRVKRGATLSAWEIANSFDSADECRNAKKELTASATHSSDRLSIANVMAKREALCIATDDPRLKSK